MVSINSKIKEILEKLLVDCVLLDACIKQYGHNYFVKNIKIHLLLNKHS